MHKLGDSLMVPSTPGEIHGRRGQIVASVTDTRYSGVAGLARRPLLFSVSLSVAFVGALVLGRVLVPIVEALIPVARSYRDSSLVGLAGLGGEIVASVLVVVLVGRLGWWRRAGFTAPRRWRRPWLVWFPAVLLLTGNVVAVATVGRWDGLQVLVEVPGQLLTGFAEEGLFRGLMLAALLAAWSHRPHGTAGAVVVSSLFFAALHLLNLLDGAAPAESVAQVSSAFMIGLAFAALCIRTGTIWLAVLVHGLVDVTGIAFTDPDPAAVGLAGLVLGMLVTLPLAGYAAILLRGR